MRMRGSMRKDLCIGTATVTIAVVPIMVGIYNFIDALRRRRSIGVGFQHILGQGHVKKCVNDNLLVAVYNNS